MNSAGVEVEKRVAALEATVAELQRKLAGSTTAPNWVEKVAGIMDDIPEEDYRKFQEYCREFRDAEYPVEAADKPESAA